jgi:hypothetical protein
MKTILQIFSLFFSSLLLINASFAKGLSEDTNTAANQQENLARTQLLIKNVEEYLRANDTYVAIVSRRGAGDPDTGVSDTDDLDLTGMAHSGFIIRNGFAKDSEYITFNLVRIKGAKKVNGTDYDLSELRVWTLPHFFIGSFEKDAIIFLPKKKVQLKLWNLLRANGGLVIEPRKRYLEESNGSQRLDDQGQPKYLTDLIITNGAFTLLHNPEYNLLSDFVENSSQNCNEHLIKTYIGFRDHWQPAESGYRIEEMDQKASENFRKETNQSIMARYTPRQMVLSRTKSTFAFSQNIRFGERYSKAPSLLGLKLKKEKFDVVSVDSLCFPENQAFLDWADFKVFRENHNDASGWFIEDRHKEYVKVNRFTKKKNSIKEL